MCARPAAWLLSAAGLALMPKCLLCLAAYAGIGALLGLTGPEICGGAGGPSITQAVPWVSSLVAVLVLLWRVARRRTGAMKPRQP